MTTLVVYVEHQGGTARRSSLEALGAASAAVGECVAVLTGPGADGVAPGLGANGATRAVVLTGRERFSPDATAAAIAEVCRTQGARGFVAAATYGGKSLAPRVAAHLDSVLFTDCVALEADGDELRVRRPWLAGKAIATLTSTAEFFCCTTRVNAFPVGEGGGTAEISDQPITAEAKAEVVAVAAKADTRLDVKEATVIVSGGRGLKEPDNFRIVEELAAAFGNAAVGASRAVVDAGWRPHAEQVGQTGKTVSPQLYIAVGISGAIQHLAGMRTARTIVAINKDPNAPIFKVADYGIVGDALEVVPALTEAVKSVKAEG